MKAYTDIKQSKMLAEILPIESADMYYPNRVGMDNYVLSIEWKKGISLLSQEIPAWSLAALINVIPYCSLRRSVDGNWIVAAEFSLNGYRESLPNKSAIEACYEMILRLHEQKVL